MTDIIVIGNGFDLRLGLKTGYSDFMESERITFLRHDENNLVRYLYEKKQTNNWFDAEALLKKYALEIFKSDRGSIMQRADITDEIEREYARLVEALYIYLAEETRSVDITETPHIRYLFDLVNDKPSNHLEPTFVFNFNYTNTLDQLFPVESELKRRHIHGSLSEQNIIFGVDDKNTGSLDKNLIFLKKSSAKHYSTALNRALANHLGVRLFVFGHSLGPSDHNYFKDVFHKNRSNGVSLYLFHYGDEGYNNMMAEISSMADGELGLARSNLTMLGLVDTKKEEPKLSVASN